MTHLLVRFQQTLPFCITCLNNANPKSLQKEQQKAKSSCNFAVREDQEQRAHNEELQKDNVQTRT